MRRLARHKHRLIKQMYGIETRILVSFGDHFLQHLVSWTLAQHLGDGLQGNRKHDSTNPLENPGTARIRNGELAHSVGFSNTEHVMWHLGHNAL